MRDDRRDHSLPTFISLLALALMLMTLDVRSQGGGLLGTIRNGANGVLKPFQVVASFVVDPLADFVSNLGDLTALRAENEALRAELADNQAIQATYEDKLARLDELEALLSLQLDLEDIASTPANVIGRTDSFDLTFRIDKGEESGVVAGNPVVDSNGYLVGRVLESGPGFAIVVPLVADLEAATVTVGDQVGSLSGVLGSDDQLVLDVFDQAGPVLAGQQVVTSAQSFAYPPSIPVGEIVADATPVGRALTVRVRAFVDVRSLRAVLVLAWPDPKAAISDDIPTPTTTIPATTTTTGAGG
jgi:rod shape-determining protein MreC